MTSSHYFTLALMWLVHIAVSVRVLLHPYRQPASRIAWIAVIHIFPFMGIAAYFLVGEIYVGRKRLKQFNRAQRQLPAQTGLPNLSTIPDTYHPLIKLAHSISGFKPVSANKASVPLHTAAFIEQLEADIRAACEHVHIVFYIWLPDHNGQRICAALIQAARRGVTCRVLADSIGSRLLITSSHWRAMRDVGVKAVKALPLGKLPPFTGRLDLRNHRKIVVIDQRITYCGSQNCADPEFRIKAKFAPWVDVMVRFEGEIAWQNQYLFASDWMMHVNENLSMVLKTPCPASNVSPVWLQVIGFGPTTRATATSELLDLVLHTARKQLIMTTPYYVPDESMHEALCAAAYRGVETILIVPARNDSWVVSAASRSYYLSLLEAGVKLYEYQKGLLHAKTLTLDQELALLGSTNLDRRSFDLNYENNLLIYNAPLTKQLIKQQLAYLADSQSVPLKTVQQWPITKRLWNNSIALLGPIL